MATLNEQTDEVRLSRVLADTSSVPFHVVGHDDPELTDVVQHTDKVVPGSLFCCVRGTRSDGHDQSARAVDAGAVALVVDHEVDLSVPQVVVADVRSAVGPLASSFWNRPSHRLTVIGVTGTNGKTTVTHLLASIFAAAGRPVEAIGTLSPGRASGVPTTPEASELQAELAQIAARDGDVVALEVSSHALDARRVDATEFAVGVFTNLSPEHLDHHGTLERYYAAKARLFEPGRCRHAVVNRDDDHGVRLLGELEGHADMTVDSYSLDDVSDVQYHSGGVDFVWDRTPVSMPLHGTFNVSNAVAAAATARVLGVPNSTIAAGLASVPTVRGRFEPVEAGQHFTVIVDYAHTPDSLRAALDACRQLTTGSVHIVFGCGGDRDRAKRPLMGKVAVRLADNVVVTSDNPRSEDPRAIVEEILAGIPDATGVHVEPDRALAIEIAFDTAAPGDVVLIAGKGHETEQIIGEQHLEFDDREAARRAWRNRVGGQT